MSLDNYNANTIKTLDFFEHIRKYPGMYIGSKDSRGLHHCVQEILSNSIDEYLNGAGDIIEVVVRKDGGIYIKDNGRGIPHGKHNSGCSLLQACFGIANTGGKFNNITGGSGYNTSAGEHGTGCKAVNALSKKMIVTSSRDNIKEIVEFSRGQFISHKEEKTSERGVSVLFYPDDEVLETITFDNNKIESMLQESAFLSKGLAFYYINEIEGIEKTFYSENGLYDYINYLNNGKKFLFEPIHFLEEEGTFQVEVAVGYNEGYNNIVKLYTNNVPQEKGTHLTGFKTAWTSVLNAIAREEKWIKDSESNLTGGDFEEGQILVLNFKMIDPVFKGQNKEELSSTEGRVYVQRLTTQALRDIDKKSLKIIFEKALKAKKAREAAKKAREAVRDNKKNQKVLRFDSKLADCYSKDRLKCEIMITEGK